MYLNKAELNPAEFKSFGYKIEMKINISCLNSQSLKVLFFLFNYKKFIRKIKQNYICT